MPKPLLGVTGSADATTKGSHLPSARLPGSNLVATVELPFTAIHPSLPRAVLVVSAAGSSIGAQSCKCADQSIHSFVCARFSEFCLGCARPSPFFLPSQAGMLVVIHPFTSRTPASLAKDCHL